MQNEGNCFGNFVANVKKCLKKGGRPCRITIRQRGWSIPDLGPEIESRLVAFLKTKFGDGLKEVLLTLGREWGEYFVGLILSPGPFTQETKSYEKWKIASDLSRECDALFAAEEIEKNSKPCFWVRFLDKNGHDMLYFPKDERTKVLYGV
jgi:hypothetical protein